KADHDELKQQVEQARLSVKLAAIEVRRLDELSKQKTLGGQPLISVVDLEKAQVALAEADSKQKSAELHVKAGEKQLKVLEEQLKFYTLTAPISGRLGRILVAQGHTVQVGDPVAEILDID